MTSQHRGMRLWKEDWAWLAPVLGDLLLVFPALVSLFVYPHTGAGSRSGMETFWLGGWGVFFAAWLYFTEVTERRFVFHRVFGNFVGKKLGAWAFAVYLF